MPKERKMDSDELKSIILKIASEVDISVDSIQFSYRSFPSGLGLSCSESSDFGWVLRIMCYTAPGNSVISLGKDPLEAWEAMKESQDFKDHLGLIGT